MQEHISAKDCFSDKSVTILSPIAMYFYLYQYLLKKVPDGRASTPYYIACNEDILAEHTCIAFYQDEEVRAVVCFTIDLKSTDPLLTDSEA